MNNSIERNIKSGILWNVVSSVARYGIQFAGIMILARMLSPSEYGSIAVLAIFISIADVVVDSGLTGAIVKKQNATQIDYSTLFVFNLVVSIVIYGAYFVAAPFVEQFYGIENLALMMRVYGLYILFFALSVVPRAKLTKHFHFRFLSLTTTAAGGVGLLVAIVCAWNGLGAFSLVYQNLAFALCSFLCVAIKTKMGVKFQFSIESFKEQFLFGINTTIANVLKTTTENIYSNIIGKQSSIRQAGFYSQSFRLMSVPVGFFYTMIDNTYFPVMSQVRDESVFSQKIAELNKKTLGIVVVVFVVLLSFHKEIVYVLLGNKWLGIEHTLMMLSFSGLCITWGNVGRNVIKSLGKTFLILKYEVAIFLANLLVLAVFYRYGYEYLVKCFFAVSLIKSICINWIACRLIRVNVFESVRSSLKSVLFFFPLLIVSIFVFGQFNICSVILKSALFVILLCIYCSFVEPEFDLLKKIRRRYSNGK